MPTVAVVDGIRIMIFPFDHDPPHLHAFGADFRIKFAIADARVLEGRGTIGPAAMRRVQSWVLSHRDPLQRLWLDAARGKPIGKVED